MSLEAGTVNVKGFILHLTQVWKPKKKCKADNNSDLFLSCYIQFQEMKNLPQLCPYLPNSAK
jgi:hypothetical protein